MLQQTQVKRVIPYFYNFTKKFKTLKALSKSNETEILKMWEGLGYYRRARNLLACSKILVKNYNSKLPYSINEIKKLPGVGDYTANALLGLIYNEPRIALDGNVKRVFSRNLNTDENKINFERFIEKNKKKLFTTNRNDDFVEALMEFGALICKPRDPNCLKCCLKKTCKYFKSSRKVKSIKKKMMKKKNFDIFCYVNNKKQIALTKNNRISFLKDFNSQRDYNTGVASEVYERCAAMFDQYRNNQLNINLYYKFSNKIPPMYNWYSLNRNKEFVPSFTKKIFRQVSSLF